MAKRNPDQFLDFSVKSSASQTKKTSDVNNNNSTSQISMPTMVSVDKEDSFLPDPTKAREETLAKINAHYKQGIEYFKAGKLEEAEQELVKAMKPVLSKNTMRALYVGLEDCKEPMLNAMYHLGKIYEQSEKYQDNYSKAVAIFQYCAGFAKKYVINTKVDFTKEAYATEAKFLASIGVGDKARSNNEYQGKIDYYKSELEGIRSLAGERLKKIEHLTIEQIAKRAKAVEEIYEESTSFFVNHAKLSDSNSKQIVKPGLVQQLLAECYEQLGAAPEGCEHAIIGFGSLAGGKMTPWSDLEFGILINEDKAEYKEYFRNLTKLLHIKVINLGETPLRSVGIESLNNFKTVKAGDDWFWDDVTNNGFKFDGSDWHACKLPLGRQGYKAEEKKQLVGKPDYELILTPEQMVGFQSNKPLEQGNGNQEIVGEQETQAKSWYGSDKHLVQALKSVVLIEGSQGLLDIYRKTAKAAEDKVVVQSRALQLLKEDVDNFSLKLGDEEEGKLFDVKKGIYRVGDRIVEALANYYDIEPEFGRPNLTVWQVIDKMASQGLLHTEGAQHLKEAISIATELRLATYCHNQGQKEGISTYVPAVEHLKEVQRKQILEETFFIKDTSILHHFYYVVTKLQALAKEFINKTNYQVREFILSADLLMDNSLYTKGLVHARFLEYEQALRYLEVAKQKDPHDIYLLNDLFFLQRKLGCIESTIVTAKQKLALAKHLPENELYLIIIADSCTHLGEAYRAKGDYGEAMEFYDESLNIQKLVYVNNPNYPNLVEDIADNYNSLGTIYYARGEFEEAVKFYFKVLEIQEKIDNSITSRLSVRIASIYSNLGIVCEARSEYDKAIGYYKKGLAMYQSIYASNPNHPVIADTYGNLGGVYIEKGQYERAIEYHNHSLEILQKIYASSPNHPSIANNYSNLGNIYQLRGEYDLAIKYYNQALILFRKVYAFNLNHPDIATSICGLGVVYNKKGEYDLAIKHYNQALEIWCEAYKDNLYHPYIAHIYNNLGVVYADKGEGDKGIEYYNRALEIQEKAYATNKKHVNIANSYNNLGNAYKTKKEYERAITYHHEALKIWQVVYTTPSNHPLIANSYNSLGVIYALKGEYNSAMQCFRDALEMLAKTYATNLYHPDIARSYGNLGGIYAEEDKYERAIEYHNKALEIWQKVYGNKALHPDIANSYRNLGNVYAKKGEYNSAIKYFLDALEIQKQVYASNLKGQSIVGIFNGLRKVHTLQNIEKLMVEKFSKLNISSKSSEVMIKISSFGVLKEDLINHCKLQLGIMSEEIIFDNKSYWITLNEKSIGIFRDKMLQSDNKMEQVYSKHLLLLEDELLMGSNELEMKMFS